MVTINLFLVLFEITRIRFEKVSVVSPLVEEAVVQYTLENPNYLLAVVSIDLLHVEGRQSCR